MRYVFFEIRRKPYPHSKDEIIHKTNLHFIWNGNTETFSTAQLASENADVFVNCMDSADILNCMPELFDDELIKSFDCLDYPEIEAIINANK